jgi:hypothetical protein
MTVNTQIKSYATTGTLQSFLLAVLFGLAAHAVFSTNISILVIMVILVAVLFLRHLQEWIVYLLGIILGVLLAMAFGIALPEAALLVLVIGACLF